MYNTRQIIEDCYLVDFVEERTNEITIIGQRELCNWSKYFYKQPLSEVTDICNFDNSNIDDCFTLRDESFFQELDTGIEEEYPIIKQILEIGNDKLCFGGPDFLFLDGEYPIGEFGFDFYFYSCTVEEATNILTRCLDLLEDNNMECNYNINEQHSKYAVTSNTVYIECFGDVRKVIFHCIIYENKGEMLRNLGPSLYRQGYDKDGYFSTISGGIMGSLGIFTLDSNFKDLGSYFVSYCSMSILLPGINRKIQEEDSISFSNGIFVRDGCYFRSSNNETRRETRILGDYTTKDILPKFIVHDNTYKKHPSMKDWVEEWNPTIIGISNDVYIVLHNIKTTFGLNGDLLSLLCFWLLIQEKKDAKGRLLALSS